MSNPPVDPRHSQPHPWAADRPDQFTPQGHVPAQQQFPYPPPGQAQYPQPVADPTATYLTAPAPKPSRGRTIGGWVLIAIGVLAVLSTASRAARGDSVLIDNNIGVTIGNLIGWVVFIVLPLWAGRRLITWHRRAMVRWRAAELAAEDALAAQRAQHQGAPRHPGQPGGAGPR